MSDFSAIEEMPDAPNNKDCKSQIFRYRENNYLSNGDTLIFSKTFRLMRRLSSRECYSPIDDIHEAGFESLELIEPENGLENGKLYRAVWIPGSKDWETGNIEDWKWKLVPYEENER